jgi:hypothetical protein
METHPLLDTILQALHTQYGFVAYDAEPNELYTYHSTTELVNGEQIRWCSGEDPALLWCFHALVFDIDEDNPPFLEIGLGVNFGIPNSPILADIKLFDVPPSVEVEDLVEITDINRWHWFMGHRIGPYIQQGEDIADAFIQQGEDIAGEWNDA